MAAGLRRLGSFLSSLIDVLTVLDRTPAPRGSEREAVDVLHRWCTERWPAVDWAVQEYGSAGANLIGRHRPVGSKPPGVLLYSHLDTSLSGGPEDVAVTGRSDPSGPLRIENDRTARGFGLGVARAPAAAALIGFAELADPASGATLLLAGSGTHRREGPTGIEVFLQTQPRPAAAVVAKSGPPGVLWSEPGAAYLTVRLVGRQGAVLARQSARPIGGVIVHVGLLIEAIESWRIDYLNGRAAGQIAPEVGIGAIRSGLWTKPDLLPAAVELGLYVVTMPGEDVAGLAAALAERLRANLDGGPLAECGVEVSAQVLHAAAATAASAPIVGRARAAWAAAFGPLPPISGWTGSTDGVVLRGRGIDTVRLGPQIAAGAEDPRRDVVQLDHLARWPPLYAALLGER